MPGKKALKYIQKTTGTNDISWLYDSDFLNVYKGKKAHTKVEKQWSRFINTNLKGGALDYDVINKSIEDVHLSVLEQIIQTYQFLRDPKDYIDKGHKSSIYKNERLEVYVNNKLSSFNTDSNNPGVQAFFKLTPEKWSVLMKQFILDYIQGTSMHQVFVKPGTVEVTNTNALRDSRMFNSALFFAPRLKQPYVVWRGLGLNIQPTKGNSFSSPVAMSTSTRSAVSIEWMLERLQTDCCLLKIHLPAGTPCLWVGKPPMNTPQTVKQHEDFQLIDTDINDMFNNNKDNPIHFQYEVILPSGLLKVDNISSIDLKTVLSNEEKSRFGQYWYKELGKLINNGLPSTKVPSLNSYIESKKISVYECSYTPRFALYVRYDERDFLTLETPDQFTL